MPVSTVIRKQTNLRLSPVGALLLRKLYLSCQGSSLFTAAITLRAPGHSSGILRHLSVTPNLQIFAKITSLIKKLAVEPDMPERPVEPKLASEAESKLEEMHKEITGSSSTFLEEYDKNLNALVKQVRPPTKEIYKTSLIRAAQRNYKKRERAQKTKEKLRFFNFDKPNRTTVTSQFKETYTFLQSRGIPCDELSYFPDIQRMTKDEITMCIERLQSYGIHKVFSLFLIQRTLAEMKIGIAVANPAKMRDGRTPVAHLSQVKLYLSLCQMLGQPDLDILALLDKLTKINGYESMATLQTKVKKLLSVGATSEILWDNLELLTISRDLFNKMIKLYKRSRPSADTPFPVALFLSKSFVAFQERLNVGQDVLDIADMLEISSEDFQACWGFKKLSTTELVQKVRMCIKVGIPKQDVFNNLSILDRISTEKCYEVTTAFQQSGLPVSIFIFKEMGEANGISGGHLHITKAASKSWTGRPELTSNEIGKKNQQLSSSTKSASSENPGQRKKRVNIILDGKTTVSSAQPVKATPPAAVTTNQTKASTRSKKLVSYNGVESSKRSRRVLFQLVAHLLSLEPEALSAMFRCCLSTTSVHRLDVTRNLDLLLASVVSGGGGFTMEQIAQCPLILVHPHAKVKDVVSSAPEMVEAYLASYALPADLASVSSSSSPTCPSHWDDFEEFDGEVEEDYSEHFDNTDKLTKYSVTNGSPADSSEYPLMVSLSSPSSKLLTSSSSSTSSSTSMPFSTLSSSSSVDELRLCSPAANESESDTLNILVDGGGLPISDTRNPASLNRLLFSCPIRHLNLLQYLLEKDSSFSLGSSDAHMDSGFLDKPL